MGCYLRLNVGLRCVFEVSIQSGMSDGQDLNHKNGVGNEYMENLSMNLSQIAFLALQHLSLRSVSSPMELGWLQREPRLCRPQVPHMDGTLWGLEAVVLLC